MIHPKLKKFLSFYEPYLGLFFTDMICALIVAAIALAFPLLTRYITKGVLASGMTNALGEIYRVGAIMLALVAIQTVCGFFVDYRGHAMGAMMERDMRNELFDHYQKLSFSFYDGQRTGQLMSRITNDLFLLTELYHHGPEDIVIYLIKFLGAFIILLTLNVKLTLVIFAFLPLLAAYVLYFGKRMKIALRTNKERIADVNAQVEDNLSGIRVVKSFANEDVERKKFAHENNRFLDSRKRGYKSEAYLSQGVSAVTQLTTVSLIVFGGVAILNASLDLADLITFLLYVAYLTEPIQALPHITTQYQDGFTGFERFMEILEIEPAIQDSEDALELEAVEGEVSFRNVGFKYHEDLDHVLRGISLNVQAGEHVAVVGPSGIGKTTLCSLIPRFYEVSEGQVLLDGVNVKDVRLSCLRRNVGVVQQEVYMFAGTVAENIGYGKPGATRDEIVEAAQKANAHQFIMQLPDGYDTDVGQRGVKLSGGQKQRLSIARVFLRNPPVLILDEATSALDNDSERVVQESLERLAENRTTFVIAHRLSTIRNADRILVLTDRGIEEQGTHEELIASGGIYARLNNLQYSTIVGG